MTSSADAIRIESLADVVRVAVAGTRTQTWYRGHGSADWSLSPHVHRDEYPTPMHEHELAQNFRSRAAPLMSNAPKLHELLEWLYIMQHHGLPTRLMDWTSSALVATYFVVWNRSHDDVDGCLWQLFVPLLNAAMGGDGSRLGKGDPNVDLSAKNAFIVPAKRKPVEMPHLAMNATHIDQRQMLQQSQFTIHDTRAPLDEHEQSDEFVRQYLVPRSAKENLRIELRSIGLNRHSLFPDLSNIALSIIDDVFDPVGAKADSYAAEKKDEWAVSDARKAAVREGNDNAGG